jgi:hypothetical protein
MVDSPKMTNGAIFTITQDARYTGLLINSAPVVSNGRASLDNQSNPDVIRKASKCSGDRDRRNARAC